MRLCSNQLNFEWPYLKAKKQGWIELNMRETHFNLNWLYFGEKAII